jgi:single-stranded DNA-binding protein
MMMNANSVILAGRLAKSPTLSYRHDGVAVLRFVLVVEEENAKLTRRSRRRSPAS